MIKIEQNDNPYRTARIAAKHRDIPSGEHYIYEFL